MYRSKVNPDYCINLGDANEGGFVSLQKCNDEYSKFTREGNLIKSTEVNDDNICLGSSDNSTEIAKKKCDENDQDQIWYFNLWDSSIVFEEETPEPVQPENVTIYFYNAYKNECINSDGSSVTTGSCSLDGDSLWEIPITHDGYYRPKSNLEKCLSIVDGVVSLSECNENTTLYRDGNFIRSPLSDDSCITII